MAKNWWSLNLKMGPLIPEIKWDDAYKSVLEAEEVLERYEANSV